MDLGLGADFGAGDGCLVDDEHACRHLGLATALTANGDGIGAIGRVRIHGEAFIELSVNFLSVRILLTGVDPDE